MKYYKLKYFHIIFRLLKYYQDQNFQFNYIIEKFVGIVFVSSSYNSIASSHIIVESSIVLPKYFQNYM